MTFLASRRAQLKIEWALLEFHFFRKHQSLAFLTMGALFVIILSLLAIFLILLILVQRGRGGGLAGALGGMGGSSAFGAKAGDVFTRITIITAAIWIALSLIAVFWAKHQGDALSAGSPSTTLGAESSPGRTSDESPTQPNGNAPPAGGSVPQAEAPIQAESAEAAPASSPANDGGTPPVTGGEAAPTNNQ
jgi:preprotein translocase subunit SecG